MCSLLVRARLNLPKYIFGYDPIKIAIEFLEKFTYNREKLKTTKTMELGLDMILSSSLEYYYYYYYYGC